MKTDKVKGWASFRKTILVKTVTAGKNKWEWRQKGLSVRANGIPGPLETPGWRLELNVIAIGSGDYEMTINGAPAKQTIDCG